MGAVWECGIILIMFAALQLFTDVLSAHTAAKASVGFAVNLRQDMYENVQTFAFSNTDKFSTASAVTRLTTDVAGVRLKSDGVVYGFCQASFFNSCHHIWSFFTFICLCVFLLKL